MSGPYRAGLALPIGVSAVELRELHGQLTDLDATVAVAESLTGGLLSAALTVTAGASRTIRGGLVVYATDLKSELAGVSASLLSERGAVDPDVALGLARGARDRLAADYGLGLTGVAGPDPQDGVDVGTVFIALAGRGVERVERYRFDGGREQIRTACVHAALALLGGECTRAITALRSP
ncbi:MAG TPA: CinA family protein [Jatrophihabitantaceae bacterium]|jgi:nicotinamide-nucleotide amidase|nr:CinA family protein [Jatrophihabitantaceae bacterium]